MDNRPPASPPRVASPGGEPRATASAAPRAGRRAWASDPSPPRVAYRCELRRHAEPEPRQIYYDGGDYNPYCLDSLADLLRREARLPHSALEIRVDLTGPCPGALLREMTLRFSSLGIARLHVVIRAEGHAPVVLGATLPAQAAGNAPAKPAGTP